MTLVSVRTATYIDGINRKGVIMKKALPVAVFLFLLAPFLYSNCSTLDITDEVIGSWTKNVAGSFQLHACCGTAPYSFAVTSGAFVGGVSMNSSGLISGTPNACDVNGYFVCITVTDANSCHLTKCFIQQVNCS